MLMRCREERGVALVVALLVTFVVMLLGTAVISLAIHNSVQSGMDRKRLQSVSAAEEGLNEELEKLNAEAHELEERIAENVGKLLG